VHAPEPQQIISDGKTLWAWHPADDQVERVDLASSALPAAVDFMIGGGRLDADFTGAVATRSDGRLALTLTPKASSGTIVTVTLVLDPTSYRVEETMLLQTDGQMNDIQFLGLKTGTGIPDTKFDFSVPAGASVFDPGKLGGASTAPTP